MIVGAVYVSDYAVCDGTTDDSGNIQAAIDATPTNGLLIFPNKTIYMASGVSVSSNFAIEGNGAILYTDQSINILNISTAGGAISGINWRDLWFQASGSPGGYGTSYVPRAIVITGSNLFFNSSFRTIVTVGMRNAISCNSFATGILIDGLLTLSSGSHATDQAIRFIGGLGNGTIISNCRIGMGAGGRGIYIAGEIGDIVIVGNQIDGSGTNDVGLYLDANVYGERFQVVGNKMDVCATPIYLNNIQGSSFVGNGFGGSVNISVNGNSAFNFYDNAKIGSVTRAFTGAFTGFSGSVTGTVRWDRHGNVVTITLPAVSGTSNTSTMTMTGMPVEIVPGGYQQVFPLVVVDGGVNKLGIASIESDGTVYFYSTIAAGPFVNSGTKGVAFTSSLSYIVRQ